MRAPDIDFRRQAPPGIKFGYMALAFAAVAGIASILLYQSISHGIGLIETERQLTAIRSISSSAAQTNAARASLRLAELSAQEEVARRLDIPWGRLFGALESTANEDVDLLRLEPDIGHRQIGITAEARGAADMIGYAKRLQDTQVFSQISVAEQKVQGDGAERHFQFVLTGNWETFAKTQSFTPPRMADRHVLAEAN